MLSGSTHDNSGDTLGRIAALLQVLGDDREDARGERHVEQPVRLFPSLFQLLQVLVELLERLILVVLARNIGTEGAERLELLFDVLGRRLDVRLDAPQVFVMVHLCSGISDDFDVLWKELVSVLSLLLAVRRAPSPPRR
jgi:hypothetical protein